MVSVEQRAQSEAKKMEETIVKKRQKYAYQTTVRFLYSLKIILLLIIFYSIFETALLVIWLPDEYRYYSSWYMRRTRLMRLQDEEIWFQPVIVIALILQIVEFISVLMEIVNLVTVFCFVEFFVTVYRFERARNEFQLMFAAFWILICLIYTVYFTLLLKLYRHSKLDKYAYRIPTPEISSFSLLGEERIGVCVKPY